MSTLEGISLSPQQKRQHELDPFVCLKIVLKGKVDGSQLRMACLALVNNHEILRTNIELVPGSREYLQVIEEHPPEFFATSLAADQPKHERWIVFEASDTGGNLYFNLPKACIDGPSVRVLVQDLAALYQNEPVEEPVQYADLTEWLCETQETEGILEPIEERVTECQTSKRPFQGHRLGKEPSTFEFGAHFVGSLDPANGFEADQLAAAWALLLWRYSRQEHVTVFVPIENRDYEGLDHLIGPLENPLPIKVFPKAAMSFDELLMDWKSDYRRQEPLQEGVVKGFVPFAFSQYEAMASKAGELAFAWEGEVGVFPMPFDLHLVCVGEKLYLHYNQQSFTKGEMIALGNAYKELLRQLGQDSSKPLEAYPLTSQQVEPVWQAEYPLWSSKVEASLLFHPNQTRIYDVNRLVQGQIIHRNMLRLALKLKDLGVKEGDRIALLLPRTSRAVIAMLAVQHLGAAWVPLEEDIPAKRLEYILKDADVRYVITKQKQLPVTVPVELVNPCELPRLGKHQPTLDSAASLNGIAYVIYTSGSTGVPKGVAVSNRALSAYLDSIIPTLDFPAHAHFAHVSSLGADLGHTVLFPPLMQAGSLHIIDKDTASDPELLARYFKRYQIDVLKIVPGQMAALLECEGAERLVPNTHLVFGGEALEPALVKNIHKLKPSCTVFNHYGPSEATVGVLTNKVSAESVGDVIPLGAPLAHVKVDIREPGGCLAPAGVVGELVIRGASLADGYVGEAGEAKGFRGADETRCYATGDLGYRLADDKGGKSDFVFLGRDDGQEKIRGFRVETREVTSYLKAIEGVKDALVLVQGDGQSKRLRAWVVLEEGLKVAAIQIALAQFFPDPMLPDVIIPIERFPRNANGKIDREQLPGPKKAVEITRFKNERERALAAIWSRFFETEALHSESNFFDLGGSSLTATVLLSRIRKAFQVDLSILAMFDDPTIRGMAKLIGDQAVTTKLPAEIVPLENAMPVALSHGQQRLWFLNQLATSNTAYNLPAVLTIKGGFDFEAFSLAFQKVISRHSILRTKISLHEGQLVQQAVEAKGVAPEFLDLRNQANSDAAIQELVETMRHEPFDFQQALFPRCKVVCLAPEHHVLIVNMHHIVTDALSREIFIAELNEFYSNPQANPPAPKLHYADYAAAMEKVDFQQGIEWWQTYLKGIPTLNLGVDFARKPWGIAAAKRLDLEFNPGMSAHLKSVSDHLGLTPFMTLMACLQILLGRLSGQHDFGIGFPVANRTLPETESMLGFFVNTLVLRADLTPVSGGELPLKELASRIRKACLSAIDNGSVPFEAMIVEDDSERDLDRSPLFQVLMLYRDSQPNELRLGDLEVSQIPCGNPHAKFDLTFEIERQDNGFKGCLEYNAGLFKPATVETIKQQLLHLIANLDPEKNVSDQALMSKPQIEQLLKQQSGSHHPAPLTNLISEIEATVTKNPEAIALEFGEETWSYAQLWQEVALCAGGLVAAGLKHGDRVGVDIQRTPQTLVHMLAVLKAGGVYVPLNPEWPKPRLKKMLEASQPVLMLGRFENSAHLDQTGHGLDDHRIIHPQQLAYILFTSGSTGDPKGVAISHGAFTNLLNAMQRRFSLTQSDRLAAVTPLSFDISGLELFLPLIAGARVRLIREEDATNPQALGELLADVTLTQATPATWEMLCAHGWKPRTSLRMLCGGEAMPPNLLKLLTAEGCSVFNMYGPTETTIWSSVAELQQGDSPHLGEPIDNTQFTIADRNGHLAPDGGIGELFIGGDGLAQGYFSNPVKTAQAFQPNPHSLQVGARRYGTGDMCRYQPSSNLIFLGRKDQQLKVRGFRIEGGEICAHLEAIDGVLKTAVLVKESRLLAFLSVENKSKPFEKDHEDLRALLAEELPAYMIPDQFVMLPSLPMNTSGKVDYKALARMEIELLEQEQIAPANELEAQMLALWQKVLEQPGLAMNHNFFQYGGHSLKAITLLNQMADVFGKRIDLRSFFENPTPMAMVTLLERADQEVLIPKAVAPFQLSPAQQRLWVLEQMGRDQGAYNMGGGIRFKGHLNIEALTKALKVVYQRHQILSTQVVKNDAGQPQLVFSDRKEVEWSVVQTEEQWLAQQAKAFISKPYQLDRERLFRVRLFRISPDNQVLVFASHHLVADDVSLGIFLSETASVYKAELKQQEASLQPLKRQYVDYAHWEHSKDRSAGLAFWENHLKEPQEQALPTDRNGKGGRRVGARHLFEIPESLHQQIQEMPHTNYQIILSAYQWLLSRFSQSQSVSVGTSVAGRDQSDIASMMGLFVNTVVMKADLNPHETFASFLERNSSTVRQALVHADTPFELVVKHVAGSAGAPLFRAFFVLHSALEKNLGDCWQGSGLQAEWIEWDTEIARFDLSLSLRETETKIVGFFQYDLNLFEPDTIEALTQQFLRLLEILVAQPGISLEQAQVLRAGVQTSPQQLESTVDVVTHFKKFAIENPEAACLAFEGRSYSYQELDRWSDQIALQIQSAGAENVVAVMAHRSPETIASLLAIGKCGAVFLPIDPQLPEARIRFMLEDTGAIYLLDRTDPSLDMPWVCNQMSNQQHPFEIRRPNPENTAYLIYTSGSTAKPKPVAVTFENLATYLAGLSNVIQPKPLAKYGLMSSISADLGNTVLYTSLAFGGCLHLLSQANVLDADQAADYFAEHEIDVLKITPSHYRALLQVNSPERLVPSNWLIFGGEALERELVETVLQLKPACKVLNHYGPTETTVGVVCCPASGKTNPAIGQAFAGADVLVTDQDLRRLATGFPGELLIRGQQVARGYQGRPALTAERFVPDPFGSFGGRLYRTGDLVRHRGDEGLVFLGRVDDQVKIRGFRIEPAEIVAKLRQIHAVNDAAVIAINQTLQAFVDADASQVNQVVLEQQLAHDLPSYMVPNVWHFLNPLPRNSNGKLDRKALVVFANQAPEPGSSPENQELSPREARLAVIWQQLLKPNRPLTRTDNFFTLGGDSILAIRLVTVARRHGFSLKPEDVFDFPSLEQLANCSDRPDVEVSQEKTIGTLALTPIQHGFFERVVNKPEHYNQSLLLRLERRLDEGKLKQALNVLADHHDALRFYFPLKENGRVQIAEETIAPPLTVHQFDEQDPTQLEAAMAAAQSSFDLASSPLWQAHYFKAGNQGYLFLLAHHLIIDTLSWSFLTEDLLSVYVALTEGYAPKLSPKTTSYKAWAESLTAMADGSEVKAELEYWQNKGRAAASNPSAKYAKNQELWLAMANAAIDEAVRYHSNSEALLLKALNKSLTDKFGVVLLDKESHGRHPFKADQDLTRSVGWFTSVHPVRLDPGYTEIHHVEEELANLPNHGLGYGVLRFLKQEQLPKAWIRFNFSILNAESLPAGFQISELNRGPARGGSSGYVLDIHIVQTTEGLRFEWLYDPESMNREEVAELGEQTLQALQAWVQDQTTQGEAAPLVDADTLADVLSAFGD